MLISGPVAAGKTSAAKGIASYIRARGGLAAAIDMDEVIEMMAGDDWLAIQHDDHLRACVAASSLVQSCFDSGMHIVAMAGSTLGQYEWKEVCDRLDPLPEVLYVLLRISLEESVRRAQNDPERVLTKNPEYVAKLAAAIDWSGVRQHDLELDTDNLSIYQVAATIALGLNLHA